jgi:hypothetical protein
VQQVQQAVMLLQTPVVVVGVAGVAPAVRADLELLLLDIELVTKF